MPFSTSHPCNPWALSPPSIPSIPAAITTIRATIMEQ